MKLRRSEFTKNMADNIDFEDDRTHLNKEAQTRRRYLKWFNKRREDFQSDREFDDYLEMVEDVIYNIANNIDVEATKARVEKYRRENQDLIGRNHAKRQEDDRLEAEHVYQTERQRIARLAELRKQDEELEEEKRRKRRQDEAEELLRIAKGDEALAKLRKKREKAERKRKRKAEAAALAEEEKNRPNLDRMWFRPQFPSAQPVPKKPVDLLRPQVEDMEVELSSDQKAKGAVAAGFKQRLVYERALREFEQSLQFAEAIESA